MSEPAISEWVVSRKGPGQRIGRSIGAVLAGMIAGIVLSVGTDVVLHMAHVFPPWGASMVGFDGPLLLATIYRTIYGLAGSTWNKGPAFGPHWYPVALVVLALPAAWVGGKLRLMQGTRA
jgi:hypothetical protein